MLAESTGLCETLAAVPKLSLTEMQTQNRIRKAQHLMKDAESITEVALTAGFCDQSHFIRHFEKYVGLTPAAYKVSCRQLTAFMPAHSKQV